MTDLEAALEWVDDRDECVVCGGCDHHELCPARKS